MADEILLILTNKQKPVVDSYLEFVAYGGLQKYRSKAQWGIREGQDLYSHLVRGGLSLHSLGKLFDLEEQEIRLLMAAFSIHDLNKLYEPGNKGLRQLADDRTFVEQIIQESGVSDFFPQWEECFFDLRQLILGHGGHTTMAGEQLLARIPGSRLSKERLQALTHLMRATDIADLSRTFEERVFKDKFTLELNSVGTNQFRLISHRLSEHRGVLSNIIHSQTSKALEEEYQAMPVFLYPEGTWYLVRTSITFPDREMLFRQIGHRIRQTLSAVRSQDLSKIVVLTKDGVKADASLFSLGLNPEEMMNAITIQVFRRNFPPRKIEEERQKCAARLTRKVPTDLPTYLSATQLHYPASEEGMRTGELIRALYNLLNIHFSEEAAHLTEGKTDPWEALYHLLGVDGSAYEPFDKLYDRPFVLGGSLGFSYQALEQRLIELLSHLLAIRAGEKEPTTSPEDFLSYYMRDVLDIDFAPRPRHEFSDYFRAYVAQNHHQCCYSAFTGRTENWMSAEVPKGILVQQFSNRLGGGVKREPKRNICLVCREQFFLEQMLFRSGGSKGMYLHFFPAGGLPAEYLAAVKQTLDDLVRQADPDTFFLPTESSFIAAETSGVGLHLVVQKARGFAVPRRHEAIGNIITLSICPGLNVSGDGARVLQSVEIGLRLAKLLDLRCLISESPIPPLIPESFLYIDTLPVALQGFFIDRTLDRQGAETLLQRYYALRTIDRNVRTGYDSLAWDLARALGVSRLEIFAVADRALERKIRSSSGDRSGALGLTLRAKICNALVQLAEGDSPMADPQNLSARVRKMAEIATEYKLWGRSRTNRNSLLAPLSIAFENLRRKSPEMDLAFVRAQTTEDIFAHVGRVRRQANPQFQIGATKRQGITAYIDEFYRILEDVYRAQLPKVFAQEKAFKAAYLCFLSETMTARKLEPLDEEPEDSDLQLQAQ